MGGQKRFRNSFDPAHEHAQMAEIGQRWNRFFEDVHHFMKVTAEYSVPHRFGEERFTGKPLRRT
ncbi:hypothetical protein D9M71_318320 [compost metagenome]